MKKIFYATDDFKVMASEDETFPAFIVVGADGLSVESIGVEATL